MSDTNTEINREILPRLQAIFSDVFDDPQLQINRESSSKTIENWDSLAHITLVSSMEYEFKVKFDLQELHDLKNVGEMIDLIERKRSS